MPVNRLDYADFEISKDKNQKNRNKKTFLHRISKFQSYNSMPL